LPIRQLDKLVQEEKLPNLQFDESSKVHSKNLEVHPVSFQFHQLKHYTQQVCQFPKNEIIIKC
jgi:hypothetical protein